MGAVAGYVFSVKPDLALRGGDSPGANRADVVANNINFAGPKSSNPAPMGDNGYAAPMAAPARPAAQQAPAPSYSAGSNDDFALIEDEGDLPF